MASVNTKGSNQWHAALRVWAADTSPEGGRWKRTWLQTGVPASASKVEAVAVANELQRVALEASPKNPMRADQRTFATALQKIWRTAGLDAPQASMSWEELVPQYVASTTAGDISRKTYRARLDHFTAFLGSKSKQLLHSVTQSDCQAFYASLLGQGLSKKTARDYLKLIGAAFELARHQHIVSVNPAQLVRTPVGSEPMKQPLTLDEVRTVLTTLETAEGRYLYHTRDEWRVVILLGLWCGMRLGDACRRKWSDFSSDLTTVTFVPEKKRKKGAKVTLPVVGDLRRHLAGLKREGDWITPRLAQTKKASEPFGKLLNAAGVSDERPEKTGDRSKPKRFKSFHSLRHTILTELAKHGVDKQLRQLLADHDDPNVNNKYTHSEVERLAEALEETLSDD